MAKYVGYKRPKDTKKTLKHLFAYLGMHKWAFLSVAVLVFISAGANIMGTYLIKPVVNKFITPGDMQGLFKAVAGMGIMYLCGAMATLFYNRLMVKTSQKVIQEIRKDLFNHTQKLRELFRTEFSKRFYVFEDPKLKAFSASTNGF